MKNKTAAKVPAIEKGLFGENSRPDRMEIIRKYMLDIRWNCQSKDLGAQVRMEYFEVLILFGGNLCRGDGGYNTTRASWKLEEAGWSKFMYVASCGLLGLNKEIVPLLLPFCNIYMTAINKNTYKIIDDKQVRNLHKPINLTP